MSILMRKEKILGELTAITDTDERYKYMISKGRALPEIAAEQKLQKFLVEGCMSQAWLVPVLKDGKIFFQVDSEAAIVKGIMAILSEVYSDSTPDEILSLSPEFLKEGGITEHLSMNRRNGLSSVVKQMRLYATVLKLQARTP